MHIFKKSKIEKTRQIRQKSMQNCMFFRKSISDAFWKDFVTVLRAKTLDFRTFFVTSAKQVLKDFFEGKKIEKKTVKTKKTSIFDWPGGMCGARGRDREGEIRHLGLDF